MSAHNIPYIDEKHPYTGLTNAMFAMWLFLASEVMLFGALFAAYVTLRGGAENWTRGSEVLDVTRGWINTGLLIFSGLGIVIAARASDAKKNIRPYLVVSSLLATAFLVVKIGEYQHKLASGIFPATHNFYALYFTLTGLHALHVAGGALVAIFFLFRSATSARLRTLALYWGFVDLVWLIIFPTLYLG